MSYVVLKRVEVNLIGGVKDISPWEAQETDDDVDMLKEYIDLIAFEIEQTGDKSVLARLSTDCMMLDVYNGLNSFIAKYRIVNVID